eukprot:CAMPEP_0179049454 /NCGR_PEP_ID=MMETSP0796-20121207/20220_1 /TAXON_ID=73915 /ORGANISM="Pyrodinium bahamense, Strain pbaha01" /LENGTH=325 /DNA_ID=CAMNT_0020745929 /DNA_START=99 /DNA_END=1076 /DNA_ORIENTATION=-
MASALRKPSMHSCAVPLCCLVILQEARGLHLASQQWQQSEENAHGVRFIRIQKNGGTTFDMVMSRFCEGTRQRCWGGQHIDWSQATDNGTWRGDVVTLLRDPVERTLSEFFWLRTSDGFLSANQSNWDFRNGTWLQSVQHEPNIEKALDIYLHGYKNNPSRNRQSLYLLGFRNGIWGAKGYAAEEPGAVYKWDERAGPLFKRLCEHLDNLTVFGITECFKPSLKVIARKLGWNMTSVMDMAGSTRMRKYYKNRLTVSEQEAGAHGTQLQSARALLTTSKVSSDATWRSLLPKSIVYEIEQMNKMDMRLYKYAQQRFTERFGEKCV